MLCDCQFFVTGIQLDFVYTRVHVIAVGKTEQERVNVDMMLENAMDFRNGVVHMVYDKDYVST